MIANTRVVAAIIAREGRLLVCQRPAHKRHGGLWEFPGGKCEPAESDADAIRRELHEELAVDTLFVGRVVTVIEDEGSEFAIAFLHVEIAGEPTAIEHSALLWAEPSDLLLLPLAPSDRRFVQHFMDSQ